MYSKNKGGEPWNITPPPGYDGSRRFGLSARNGEEERSDGRDARFLARTRPIYRGKEKGEAPAEAAPMQEMFYGEPALPEPEPMCSAGALPGPCPEDCACGNDDPPRPPVRSPAPPCPEGKPQAGAFGTLLSALARDDLLLLTLLILLSGERGEGGGELLLLLALLLLVR